MTILVGLTASTVSGLRADEAKFGAAERLEVPGLKALEGPEVVDVDGDGVADLLSGVYAGNLLFRKNTGTNTAPKYAEPVKVQRGGEDIKLKHW